MALAIGTPLIPTEITSIILNINVNTTCTKPDIAYFLFSNLDLKNCTQ